MLLRFHTNAPGAPREGTREIVPVVYEIRRSRITGHPKCVAPRYTSIAVHFYIHDKRIHDRILAPHGTPDPYHKIETHGSGESLSGKSLRAAPTQWRRWFSRVTTYTCATVNRIVLLGLSRTSLPNVHTPRQSRIRRFANAATAPTVPMPLGPVRLILKRRFNRLHGRA